MPIPDVESVESDALDDVVSVTCDRDGSWETLEVAPGIDLLDDAHAARFTPDELNVYLHSDETGDLYVAKRTSRDVPFAAPVRIGNASINSVHSEFHPQLDADERTLFFASNRNGSSDIFAVDRTSKVAPFDTAYPLTTLNSSNSDYSPWATEDGNEIYLASNRTGGVGSFDIYRAGRNGSSYGTPINVTELNTSGLEVLPMLTRDRLTIYFSSSRVGGKGQMDIWVAHRLDKDGTFSAPVNIPEINSEQFDYVSWISPDGCRLYLESNRTGSFVVYVAERSAAK